MNHLRRFLVLQLLAFSFGGFLFYAGIVVPIGTELLGATTQGFVTRQVTRSLNLATLFCLLGLFWEILAGRKRRDGKATFALSVLTAVIALCATLLWLLHGQLDKLLLPDDFGVREPSEFYALHRLYLWISTVQWLCSLPIVWIVVNTGLNCPRRKDLV